jgi:hypothetical protein
MTLQNMRANGVRPLAIQCHQCRHEVIMNVDHLPRDLTLPSFGPKIVCTKCGTIGADVRPNWRERERLAPMLAPVGRHMAAASPLKAAVAAVGLGGRDGPILLQKSFGGCRRI